MRGPSVPRRLARRRPRPARGFSLVELVMVIVLTGIVATFGVMFIVEPMRAYVDQSRRAALVDDAELALKRMAREIRGALPNSVRVDGTTLSFHDVVSAARYRVAARPDPFAVAPDDADAILQFDRDDGSFHVVGGGFGGLAPFSSSSHRLVVHNLGDAGGHIGPGAATPVPTTISIAGSVPSGEQVVTLSPPFRFAQPSPERRIYLTSANPVVYACNGGTLTRDGVIVVTGVTGCSFAYQASVDATRFAVVSLQLTLSRGGEGNESVTMLRQVHVENVP